MESPKQSIYEFKQLLHNIAKKLEKEDFQALKYFASDLSVSELEKCTKPFSLLVKLYDADVISQDKIGWLRVAFNELGHKPVLEMIHDYDTNRNIGPYKVMLCRVAKEIEQAALEDLTELSPLDRSTRDAISTPLELFTALERRGDLSASNVRFLVELLHQMDDNKLAKIVTDYEEQYSQPITAPRQRTIATSQNRTPAALSLELMKRDKMDPDSRHTQEMFMLQPAQQYDPGQTFPKFQEFEMHMPYLLQSGHVAADHTSGMKQADKKLNVDSPNTSSTVDERSNAISSKEEVKVKYSKSSNRELLKDGANYCPEGYQNQTCLCEMITADGQSSAERIAAAMEQLSLSNSQRIDEDDHESKSIDHQETASAPDKVLAGDSAVYTIHCMNCECLLCNTTDLRKRGTNIVVICPEYEDKVIVKKKAKPNENTLYKQRVGYTLCKTCQKQLGPEFVYKQGSPRDFGLSRGAVKWKLSSSDEYHVVEDWKAVPFNIKKQKINEMID